jgi:ubiquinone/menaquinone biosynthesis C-methylase UbiE
VLDIGCGPAIMAQDMLDRNCEFWGMDVSKEMIRQGEERFSGNDKVHLSTGTAEVLEFPDNTFDTVMSMGVIEFVDNDQQALEEMMRVLKPDGTLIVAFMSKHSPFRLWRDFVFYPLTALVRPVFYRFTKRLRKPHIKQRTYTEKAIRNLLSQNQYAVSDVVYCNFNIFLPPLEHIFSRLSAVVSSKLEFLGRSKLKLIGGAFVIKARKIQ